jgi:hypothetical protein
MSTAIDDGENLIEILSTSFSNMYFNSLYADARDSFNDDKFKSIDMAYRVTVETYTNAFKQTKKIHGKDNEHYPRIMGVVCANYNKYIKTQFTYVTFMDLLARTFIPGDIYADLTYTDESTKAGTVRSILIKTISEFTVYVLTDQFKTALSLETRGSPQLMLNTASTWKAKFKELLRKQISEYQKFIIAKKNGVDLSKPNQIDMVPIMVLEKLQDKLRDSINSKTKITIQYNKLIEFTRLLRERVAELENYIQDELEPKIRYATKPSAPLPVSEMRQVAAQRPTQQQPIAGQRLVAVQRPVSGMKQVSELRPTQQPVYQNTIVKNIAPVDDTTDDYDDDINNDEDNSEDNMDETTTPEVTPPKVEGPALDSLESVKTMKELVYKGPDRVANHVNYINYDNLEEIDPNADAFFENVNDVVIEPSETYLNDEDDMVADEL